MHKVTTYSAVKAETEGKFWDDSISVDKAIIGANYCPHCHRSLTYFGKSNAEEYRAYGVCQPCDYAKLFWIEGEYTTSFKKKICASYAKG